MGTGKEHSNSFHILINLLDTTCYGLILSVNNDKDHQEKGDVFTERIQLTKTEKILAAYVYVRYRFFGF